MLSFIAQNIRIFQMLTTQMDELVERLPISTPCMLSDGRLWICGSNDAWKLVSFRYIWLREGYKCHFFLYFSFTSNYGLKWSHLDVFPPEPASSLEKEQRSIKNQIGGFFSKIYLNYTFTSIQLQIKPIFFSFLCLLKLDIILEKKRSMCFVMQQKHWYMHPKV